MELRFEDSEKQVRIFGRRVLNRMRAAGARTVQLEDILSELTVAWCQARDHWNSQAGVPFGAYLFRGMRNHINRWAQKEINVHNIAPYSMDAQHAQHDYEDDFHEVLTATDEPTPEDKVVGKDQAERFLLALSPNARLYIDNLMNPPDWLVAELKAMQAKAKFGRARGLTSMAPQDVNSGFVMTALGFDRAQRKAVHDEVKALLAFYSADECPIERALQRLGRKLR